MSNEELANFVALQPDKYTEPLVFVPGEFRLSKEGQVPYLAAVMPLQNIVDQIMLVEDISEEAQLNWSLEELFQRDIDWKRVETELVNGYLRATSELSFFNSLTIALLPQTGLKIEENYGQPEFSPDAAYPGWKKIDVGNICVEYNSDRSIGAVRWHKQRVFPVAIDGQHRLAALKQYCKDLDQNRPELETKIPLLFLILDERVGFKGIPEKPIIETLRKIFIDLNKNARNVPKSRVILLEDRNIQSLCVRTLLASSAQESSDALPLCMVTWREDEAKFDSGYSITSVLNLYEIVSVCLGRSLEATDLLEKEEVARYVAKITGKLVLGADIQTDIKDRTELLTGREELFSFEKEHLDALKEAFREQWAPYIVQIFREFVPYKQYLSTAKQVKAIDGMLADFLLLSEEKRRQFREKKIVEDKTFNPQLAIDTPLEMLTNIKRNEWAFYVVFQKALFINFFTLEAQSPSLFDDNKTREDFLTWWIDQVNALHKQGVFNLDWKAEKGKTDLWLGIAKNPGSGSIQYSQAAANRISSFITICIYFKHGDNQHDESKFAADLADDSPSLPKTAKNAFKTVRNGLGSLIKAKAADEIDDQILEKMVKQELVKRLKAIQE